MTQSVVCYQKHLMEMVLLSFYDCSYGAGKQVKWWGQAKQQNQIQLLKYDIET